MARSPCALLSCYAKQSAANGEAMIRTARRLVLLAIMATATIGCDRVTKHVAETTLVGKPSQSFFADTVRIVYAENTGGFLSLGANLPPAVRTVLFVVSTGLVLLALIGLGLRANQTFAQTAGLVLFIAGGASNWVDRFTRGSVVDFLNVGIGWLRTGIFNFADVAIMLGVAVFLLAELRDRGARANGTQRSER